MKISPAVLRRYTPIPDDNKALRALLDDVGVEVKRVHGDGPDATFTLELLANRGDHHCYEGVAREINGRTGGGVTPPEVAALTVGDSPVPLRLETPLCYYYSATLLERSGPDATLPPEALAPLTAAGIHSLTAPVDATNLSNLELGQPTHAFDADTIDGGITVRLSRAGERAWLLFKEGPIDLPEGLMVIADDSKILAIAGVIGCEESKTTESTTRLLLESAAFDPVTVRKGKQALNKLSLDIYTDSAARFERGSDPARPLIGAGRVVHLLETHAGWRRVGPSGIVGDWAIPERAIDVYTEPTNAFLELALEDAEIADRLSRYGFVVSQVAPGHQRVQVPTWRIWDVEFRADLYEELAKSVGYNDTPTTLPAVEMGALPSPAEVVKAQVEEVLLGDGFYEVFTDGFYGKETLAKLGLADDHPLQAHVNNLNSLERGYSLLKNNGLAQALSLVAANLRVRHRQIKAYEWTRTFHPDPSAENGVCRERPILWAVVNGRDRAPGWSAGDRPADALFLRGLIEEIGAELGLPLTFGPVAGTEPLRDLLHPGRQAGIYLNGAAVGVFGEIHPLVVERFRIKRARPCYLEISVSALNAPAQRAAYRPPSVHQPLVRSLAFALPLGIEAGRVAGILSASEGDLRPSVAITDLFAFEADGAPLRAVTFELRFENPAGDLRAETVNNELEALVARVVAALGDRGVYQRT